MNFVSGMSFLRWRLRQLINLLPARKNSPPISYAMEQPEAKSKKFRMAYLFAGTYGDFVQSLRPLQVLAQQFPRGEVLLLGAEDLALEFASELPSSLRTVPFKETWQWLKFPVDLLFTNAVGVYRVRFDLLARFGALDAYGFRHSHELRRGSFFKTLVLDSSVQSFAKENLRVLALASIAIQLDDPPSRITLPSQGGEKILFHIGSAGLKKDFGLQTYMRLVLEILAKIDFLKMEIAIVMGPGDEDIAHRIQSVRECDIQIYPMDKLMARVKTFNGSILCFNSFFAHLCHYLGLPAIVIHRQAIPYGYDCRPVHEQIALKSEKKWDLGEVWAVLEKLKQ